MVTPPPSSPTHSSSSSGGSLSGFPEEDLREGGRNNSGYFPARLGQCLDDGRYVIVRKLGWGQYSSVWLARDREEDRFVALKILTCESTKALTPGTDQRSDEQRMLGKIASADPAHRGFRHTLAYYDTFEFESAHGAHRCLVTEPLGYGVDYVRKLHEDHRISLSTVKRIVRQVLLGLAYLHEVCGIVHADLKHDNILFRPPDLLAVVSHELIESPSLTYDCGTLVNPPIVPVRSQSLPLSPDAAISENELDVVLADVGHSQWKDRHFQEVIQPIALRAPEVILGYPWSTPADIWSLGCLITEWLIGSWLFEPNRTDDWSYEEDHLARMMEALEARFESSFLEKSQHKAKFFNPEGTFLHFTTHKEPTWPLRKLLEEDGELSGDALDATERFLKGCLQLTPENRATATELLEDPWLSEPS